MRRRLLLGALGAAALMMTCAPAPAGALVTGLSESDPSFMTAPLFTALAIDDVRIVVPYDAALTNDAATGAWLAAAQAHGLRPLVAFEHRRHEDCDKAGSACTLPTEAQYRAAVDAFIARWPWVTTYTAWNEPNHASQPTYRREEWAGRYWAQLRQACPACTVVAGDFLDDARFDNGTAIAKFQSGAGAQPAVWGLHNYYDATYLASKGVDKMLQYGGEVWMTETGGIVRFGNLGEDEQRAKESLDWLYGLAASRPRVTRMYVYEWQGYDDGRFDAGLLRRDGSARPGYDVVAAHVGRRPAPPGDAATCGSNCATPPAPPADGGGPTAGPGGAADDDRVPAREGLRPSGKAVRLVRARGLRFSVSCLAAADCSGTLRLTLPKDIRPRRVEAAVKVAAYSAKTVVLKVPAQTRRALGRRMKATVSLRLCDRGTCTTSKLRLLTR